jgi:hypothetical protein
MLSGKRKVALNAPLRPDIVGIIHYRGTEWVLSVYHWNPSTKYVKFTG